jgi:hypothetical protein
MSSEFGRDRAREFYEIMRENLESGSNRKNDLLDSMLARRIKKRRVLMVEGMLGDCQEFHRRHWKQSCFRREPDLSLSEFDQDLLKRCINRQSRAWEGFTDRFSGLILKVALATAEQRGLTLSENESGDLVAEVFLEIMRDDFRLLREFHETCSLASYLTVLARRVIVKQLQPQNPTDSNSDPLGVASEN